MLSKLGNVKQKTVGRTTFGAAIGGMGVVGDESLTVEDVGDPLHALRGPAQVRCHLRDGL